MTLKPIKANFSPNEKKEINPKIKKRFQFNLQRQLKKLSKIKINKTQILLPQREIIEKEMKKNSKVKSYDNKIQLKNLNPVNNSKTTFTNKQKFQSKKNNQQFANQTKKNIDKIKLNKILPPTKIFKINLEERMILLKKEIHLESRVKIFLKIIFPFSGLNLSDFNWDLLTWEPWDDFFPEFIKGLRQAIYKGSKPYYKNLKINPLELLPLSKVIQIMEKLNKQKLKITLMKKYGIKIFPDKIYIKEISNLLDITINMFKLRNYLAHTNADLKLNFNEIATDIKSSSDHNVIFKFKSSSIENTKIQNYDELLTSMRQVVGKWDELNNKFTKIK